MSRRCFATLVWVLASLIGFSSVGCGPSAERVSLVQPQLSGWQRELKLQSERVHWAGAGDEGVERVLAEFPLPGARTGQPTYILYLRLPAGAESVSFGADASTPGRGFLIQARGEYAGLARVTGGSVAVRGRSRAQAAKRQLRLDLTCEDGSRIVGEIGAFREEYVVSQFETKRRSADVAKLIAQIGEPTSRPQP